MSAKPTITCPKCGEPATDKDLNYDKSKWIYTHHVRSRIPGIPQVNFCVVRRTDNNKDAARA